MKMIRKKKKKATLMLREDCRVAGKAQSHPKGQTPEETESEWQSERNFIR
jgi:hypothetical protein